MMIRRRAVVVLGRRFCSSATTSNIRNVGVIAHIDAGKTTTTERMLLLAGVTRTAGNVDDGDTVMDHLDQERERGITIQAAATAFRWDNHDINLIDTPGHVDFTIEVERSARVLDGAALIVDAVAGAQAQTETVWRQASTHGVPAVAFINKMDREGADFDAALASLEERLGISALPLQLPLPLSAGGGGGGPRSAQQQRPQRGAIDLIGFEVISYAAPPEPAAGGRHRRGVALDLERSALPGAEDLVTAAAVGEEDGRGVAPPSCTAPNTAELAEAALSARATLIERVADLEPDGPIAELYLSEEPVPPALLRDAVRRLTLSRAVVPALCGASLQGVGVEPLLDAIVAYLPAPEERNQPVLSGMPQQADGGADETATSSSASSSSSRGESSQAAVATVAEVAAAEAADAVALAFKVVHDRRSKKPVVWLRVYSGDISAGDVLHNPRTGEVEKLSRLQLMHGQMTSELPSAGPGAICAAVGMKRTRTGDTLLLRPRDACAGLQLPELRIPSAVVYNSVEVASQAQQADLDEAIEAILLEDPSVETRTDPTTGQQLLGGMGELHLEVCAHRLRTEFGLELYTGDMQVGYREGITAAVTHESSHAPSLGGDETIKIVLAIRPQRGVGWAGGGDGSGGSSGGGAGGGSALSSDDGGASHVTCHATEGVRKFLQQRELTAAFDGLKAAGAYGELYGYPLIGMHATILSVHRPRNVGPDALRRACAEALPLAVATAAPVLLEPLMAMELRAPEKHIGTVLRELTGRRRAEGLQVAAPSGESGATDLRHTVSAEVPLAMLVGYAGSLRSMTAGEASFSMELARYGVVDEYTAKTLFGF